MNNLEDSVGGGVDGDVFVMEESRKERVMEREHRQELGSQSDDTEGRHRALKVQGMV